MGAFVENLTEVGRRLIGMIDGTNHASDKRLAWCAGRVAEGADEIERLRAIIRVNGLRVGATHAEIDALISPNEEGKTDGNTS